MSYLLDALQIGPGHRAGRAAPAALDDGLFLGGRVLVVHAADHGGLDLAPLGRVLRQPPQKLHHLRAERRGHADLESQRSNEPTETSRAQMQLLAYIVKIAQIVSIASFQELGASVFCVGMYKRHRYKKRRRGTSGDYALTKMVSGLALSTYSLQGGVSKFQTSA